jgi:putative integral membrane protein (TIGR02587 family)
MQAFARPGGREVWRREGNDLLRGLTSSFLIGIPLLYTMETWWIGQTVTIPQVLIFIAATYVTNLGFVFFTGFRRGDQGSRHAVRPFGDALETTALAILATAITLMLLWQLKPGQALDTVIGRIAVDAFPLGLGAAIANHILTPEMSRASDDNHQPGSDREAPQGLKAIASDAGGAFAGALFLSLNIAPTQEVQMLATEIPTLMLPVLIVATLVLTYAIVFEAGFRGQERRRGSTGPFQSPLTETVAAYIVALATCAGLLWLFGRIDADTTWHVSYAQVIVLGMPAAIGAAAGRLAMG